jgi:DNA-binding HxlR family transcriptional regulator
MPGDATICFSSAQDQIFKRARLGAVSTRTYAQHCGLARSLDLLGERWTLLVIRELALGPRRYGDLAAALPGIGTNLLAARLRALTEAGVVRQATLPPPAGVRVYELTERGDELRAPLLTLALWGLTDLPAEPVEGTTVRAAWAALSMGAVADGHPSPGVRGTFAFHVGDERFHVTLGDGPARVRLGVPPAPPVADVTTDAATFFALATAGRTPADAVVTGDATIDGDADAVTALFEVFRLPVAPAA